MEVILEQTNELVLEGKRCTLRYGLLAQRIEGRTLYGVVVSNDSTGEQEMVPDVALHQVDGETLVNRITAGGVTPVALRDVVEDFLTEI